MITTFTHSIKTGPALSLAILLVGCATTPPTIVPQIVGPELALKQKRNGFLTVYSATAWIRDSDGPSLLGHTDYEIHAPDGTLFETVRNGEAEPARVLLPEGTYIVEAQSDTSGEVNVPVEIEAGETTIVHLEREKDWKEAPAGNRRTILVRLPNGQPIGVRARGVEVRDAS